MGMSRLTLSDEYLEGEAAFDDGLSLRDCPYGLDSYGSKYLWTSGFKNAMDNDRIRESDDVG